MTRPARQPIVPMFRLKASIALFLFVVCSFAWADTGSIKLSAFPELAVADARSTITVTAEVRQNSGRPAADGTQVVFQTTIGHFQESRVGTVDGYARAVLVAGGNAGMARITASALSLTATSTTEIEFVASRSELSSANSYVQIEAPIVLRYDVDTQILAASGASHAVTIQMGKATIQTDDMQFNVATQELRARRAKVTVKGHSYEFAVLSLNASSHRAVGTTSYSSVVATPLRVGKIIVPIVKNQRRMGLMQLKPSGELAPVPADAPPTNFEFQEMFEEDSQILAKRAVIFPGREIQFQRAQINLSGMKIMSSPLYSLNLANGAGSLGDQVLTVNNNKVGINYPYYMSLTPQFTSLFRFTTGQTYGRSLTGNSASLLNYEMTWNKADGAEGGLTLTGINRRDWSVDARHSLGFGDGSHLTALVSSPQRRSVFGSIGYSKPLNGYQFSLSANANQMIVGPKSDQRTLSAVLESDPRRVHSVPLTLFYGLTATDSRTSFEDTSRSSRSTGLRLRGQFDPFSIDRSTKVNTSFALGQRWGQVDGLTTNASLSLSRSMPWGALTLNYDYADDSSFAAVAAGGKQRLSLDTNYGVGKLNLHLFASRSLDADWSSFYGDMSFQVSPLYTLSAGYTLDKYLSETSLDYDLMLSYRVGIREVGLVWSRKTNKIGIEILGARF